MHQEELSWSEEAIMLLQSRWCLDFLICLPAFLYNLVVKLWINSLATMCQEAPKSSTETDIQDSSRCDLPELAYSFHNERPCWIQEGTDLPKAVSKWRSSKVVKVASSGIRTSKPVCLVVRCEGGLTLHWACAYARAHRVTVLRITLEFAREIGLKT